MDRMKIKDIRRLGSPKRVLSMYEHIKNVWPEDLIDLCKKYIYQGYLRYGADFDVWYEQFRIESSHHTLARALIKLLMAIRTGNTEYLIDVINYCVFVWSWPDHTMYFKHTSSDSTQELFFEARKLSDEMLRKLWTGSSKEDVDDLHRVGPKECSSV